VLNHVEKSGRVERKTDIASLAICFELGHCPQGLFGLISHLVSPEENQVSFDLSEDKIYQDQVCLMVNSGRDVDEIVLKRHLSHIEVAMFLESASSVGKSKSLLACRNVTPNIVCSTVRSVLQDCLQLSMDTLHYDRQKLQPVLCLSCPNINCSSWHEVEWSAKDCSMHCKSFKAKYVVPSSGLFWFSEGKIRDLHLIIDLSWSLKHIQTAIYFLFLMFV